MAAASQDNDAVSADAHPENDDVVASSGQQQTPPQVLIQDHHIRTIQSTISIRQLPSQGLSFQLWPAATTLLRLLDSSSSVLRLPTPACGLRILELGSGTGLVGIGAAAVLGASVMVTDLPRVLSNLEHNVSANADVMRRRGGSVRVAALRWGEEADVAGVGDEFDVVVASDVVYYVELYEPLLKTLRLLMCKCNNRSSCNESSDHWVSGLSATSRERESSDRVTGFIEQCRKGGQIDGLNRSEEGWGDRRKVFIMAHLRRWKKDSMFFKRAKKYFDVEVVHVDSPNEGCRIGVVVYRFVPRDLN